MQRLLATFPGWLATGTALRGRTGAGSIPSGPSSRKPTLATAVGTSTDSSPPGRAGRHDARRHAAALRSPGLARRGTALDFGCGLGRLTRALAPQFERTYGLDVASTMIDRAQRLDTRFGRSGAVFVRHGREDLSRYPSGSVDFLSCLLVLQHLPSRDAIERYLREFVRVLSPGGVAVVHAHPGGVMSRTYFVAPRDGGPQVDRTT